MDPKTGCVRGYLVTISIECGPVIKVQIASTDVQFLSHPANSPFLLTAVNKAHKMFDDEEQLQYCMGVAEEAKEVLKAKIEEKRKLAKKDGKTSIEEDDPVKVYNQVTSTLTKCVVGVPQGKLGKVHCINLRGQPL